MGGQKAQEIGLHPILTQYAQEFRRCLCAGDARLMVIGYGFRDQHINDVIVEGIRRHNLKFFNISPEGSTQAKTLNSTRRNGAIVVPTELEEGFRLGLIGASRRPLRDTFGGDTAEFNKVHRFFG